MTLSDKQWLFLQDVAKLIQFAKGMGFKLTGGELFRTKEQQELHIKAGRSTTTNSRHLDRLAIDFNIWLPDGTFVNSADQIEACRILGEYWKALNPAQNRWGGDWTTFKEAYHFERLP